MVAREIVTALQAMRGIDLVAAVTVLAEIGDLSRFQNPRELMGYLGLVPSESSTGDRVKRGGITKAGNGRARSSVDLSVSSAREPREAGKGRGRAEARARDSLESPNPIVRSLPVAHAERQAADSRHHSDCPRAIGLHLGDQSRGHSSSTGVREEQKSIVQQ